jgi:pimeloyl-ACP methyl ester carboxylesterase
VARDVARVADALGIRRSAVIGHSGGGPHVLACAVLRPDRVLATVAMSSPAHTARPLERYLASHEFDPDDALAEVAPWGFTTEQAKPPVLLVHGDEDRMVPSTSRCSAPRPWPHWTGSPATAADYPATPRCWGGRLIRAANRSRRLTTPWTRRPSITGR